MAKKKDLLGTLKSERYLVWAIVIAVAVAIGLIGKISVANVQSDTESTDGQSLVTPTHSTSTVHHR